MRSPDINPKLNIDTDNQSSHVWKEFPSVKLSKVYTLRPASCRKFHPYRPSERIGYCSSGAFFRMDRS